MRFSQTDKKALTDLSIEEITNIVYGFPNDDGSTADVALLLGSNPRFWQERASAAAKLYLDGRVKYIVASGGVAWDYQGKKLTEAEGLAHILKEKGVPEEAIILDNEAKTTVENMVCGTLAITRKRPLLYVKSIFVVTSPWHMRRSMALANNFLPKLYRMLPYPAISPDGSRERWHEMEDMVARIKKEILLLKTFIDLNMIEDIEY